MAACNSHGIPNGGYRRCNENGEFFPEDGTIFSAAPEDYWTLNNNKAEYRYAKFKVIEIDDGIYLDHSSIRYPYGEPVDIHVQYQVEYDKSTKILTVYMPSVDGVSGPLEGDVEAFYFKIKD